MIVVSEFKYLDREAWAPVVDCTRKRGEAMAHHVCTQNVWPLDEIMYVRTLKLCVNAPARTPSRTAGL